MKKALKRHGLPEAITTDGLRSYGAAMDALGNREKQEVGRWANNRPEGAVSLMRTALHRMHFALWRDRLVRDRLPLRQCGGAAFLVGPAVDEVAFECEMIVHVGVDRGKFL